jgi:site-specific DNA-methyltransferase (adenine-specific)
VGTKRVKAETGSNGQGNFPGHEWGLKGSGEPVGVGDADGLETVEAWECVEGCPVRELDGQSGVLTSGGFPEGMIASPTGGVAFVKERTRVLKGRLPDTGTAARFFTQLGGEEDEEAEGTGEEQGDRALRGLSPQRFVYQAKPSRAEREAGLLGVIPCCKCGGLDTLTHLDERGREVDCLRNRHPTVKSLALMRWLCKLTRPPSGGVILDPFAGSGTTLCAAVMEGRAYIGIEQDEGYCEIARARVAHWTKVAEAERRAYQPSLF